MDFRGQTGNCSIENEYRGLVGNLRKDWAIGRRRKTLSRRSIGQFSIEISAENCLRKLVGFY